MAKKILVRSVLILGLVLGGNFSVSVIYAKPPQEPPVKPAGQNPQEAARKAEAEKAQAKLAKAQEIIKSQDWNVALTTEEGKDTKETEVITFTPENKVSFKNLLAKGYTDSNYKLTVQEDGAIVWETMKVNKEKEIVFLRGELRGSSMKGSMFFKPQKGKDKTLYFTNIEPVSAPAAKKEAKSEAVSKSKKGN